MSATPIPGVGSDHDHSRSCSQKGSQPQSKGDAEEDIDETEVCLVCFNGKKAWLDRVVYLEEGTDGGVWSARHGGQPLGVLTMLPVPLGKDERKTALAAGQADPKFVVVGQQRLGGGASNYLSMRALPG
eukprot:4568191-Karenia_brevis.AAC.1